MCGRCGQSRAGQAHPVHADCRYRAHGLCDGGRAEEANLFVGAGLRHNQQQWCHSDERRGPRPGSRFGCSFDLRMISSYCPTGERRLHLSDCWCFLCRLRAALAPSATRCRPRAESMPSSPLRCRRSLTRWRCEQRCWAPSTQVSSAASRRARWGRPCLRCDLGLRLWSL